ncbi:MAG TPA: hypothetical protein PKJ99_06130 [Thermoanaerobaculales bacterium]|nr:hypothetical protein [Thermoanaerobaculales bacterium]HQL30032.1 hypothetical protein [Thermoanaerobaculales bacterium]
MRRAILPVLVVLLHPCSASRAADGLQRVTLSAGAAVIAEVPASPGALPPSESPAAVEGERSGWQLQQTVTKVLKAVSFADPMNGYAAAELGAVYRTIDGGQSWTTVMDVGFPYYWYGVQAFSAETALVVGFQNSSGAGVGRWTDDGGATWTPDIVIDPANWLLGLEFADALHGIAYGNLGYVYTTDNGGRNAADWTKVSTSPDLGWLSGNFTFRDDLNAYITGIHFCHSDDGGLTWSSNPSADPTFDGGCSFPDLENGWTGGGQISAPVSGWVHRTTDGGATWSGRLLQTPYPIRVVRFFDANLGIAAGGNIYSSAGGIWSTTDGGATWNLDLDTGAEMSDIDAQAVAPDSLDVWCVGFLPNFTGVIYKKRIAPAAVFADGFESGDTSAWSATVP